MTSVIRGRRMTEPRNKPNNKAWRLKHYTIESISRVKKSINLLKKAQHIKISGFTTEKGYILSLPWMVLRKSKKYLNEGVHLPIYLQKVLVEEMLYQIETGEQTWLLKEIIKEQSRKNEESISNKSREWSPFMDKCDINDLSVGFNTARILVLKNKGANLSPDKYLSRKGPNKAFIHGFNIGKSKNKLTIASFTSYFAAGLDMDEKTIRNKLDEFGHWELIKGLIVKSKKITKSTN